MVTQNNQNAIECDTNSCQKYYKQLFFFFLLDRQ